MGVGLDKIQQQQIIPKYYVFVQSASSVLHHKQVTTPSFVRRSSDRCLGKSVICIHERNSGQGWARLSSLSGPHTSLLRVGKRGQDTRHSVSMAAKLVSYRRGNTKQGEASRPNVDYDIIWFSTFSVNQFISRAC